MSILFAREGAAVAVADIKRDSAEATAQRVRAEGADAAVVVADASDEAAVAEMFARARGALGGLDGLVLNVGIGAGRGRAAPAWRTGPRARGQPALALPRLQARARRPRRRRGHPAHGLGGLARGHAAAAYAASKAALEALCRQAAVEAAPRLRVNLLLPGLIDTSLGRMASRLSPARERVKILAGRQGTGWEVAYAALYLLGPESAYVTGQTLIVDGGLTVAPRA